MAKRMAVRVRRSALLVALLVLALFGQAAAQGKVTTPKEQFGANVGDDYVLINYTQMQAYWSKLAKESDRMRLVEIGKTAEGRPMVMAIISSPQNLQRLDHYKGIVRKLALAEGLTDDEARKLAAEGKAVVWIDGGLHATEVVGSQQLIEMVYQMVSRSDGETQRFLNDVIMLAVPANPDGQELVANWYMREPEPTKRSTGGLPRLYQKYVGHDNNRDSYMAAMPETEAMSRVLYTEWFPQVMYNHHQTGPEGTVLFAPPFRDPFNYNFDPLVPIQLDLVAAAMHTRFIEENKPGATMRSGANYSTWWNGGLRTTVYFHNMVGLLTEIIGNPTPIELPLVLQRQLPRGDLPFPIAPQKVWHMRQSIEYSITANRAVLDVVSKHREQFLFNQYRMGKNSIERGNRDTWTIQPKRVAAVEALIPKPATPAEGGGGRGRQSVPAQYFEKLRDPKLRDPRGYILPSDQADFLTATKFVNTLIKSGIAIHRATAPFEVGGKKYPAGSFVVKAAQAFRPHVLDMFEPQDHPNDFAYPGGPPRPPYDSAGYTLAFQMGVQFDRILDGFEGPFEKVNGFAPVPAGRVVAAAKGKPAGFLLSHQVNDGFIATNRLLAAKADIYWLQRDFAANGKTYPVGTVYIPAKAGVEAQVSKLATELGLSFEATAAKPTGAALLLKPLRIALWDRYGGSMPSGWTRWLLEQFQFPFEVVYPQTLDAGNLNAKYDVIVFVDGAIPERDTPQGGGGGFGAAPAAASIPAEYRGWLGNVTVGKTVPQIKAFLEQGGTVLTIGSSTSLAKHLGLPVADALVERSAAGERRLTNDKYYIPGSVLQAAVDNTQVLAYGLPDRVDLFFDDSPAFRLTPEAARQGVKPVAWYDSAEPLRSGWAWGQTYLEDTVAVIDAPVGRGRLVLFGPEVLFRAQPHGTFKLFFNGLLAGGAKAVSLGGR